MVDSSQLMSACTARQQHIVPLPPLCTRGRDHLYHLWCTMIFHDIEKSLTIPSDRPLEGF